MPMHAYLSDQLWRLRTMKMSCISCIDTIQVLWSEYVVQPAEFYYFHLWWSSVKTHKQSSGFQLIETSSSCWSIYRGCCLFWWRLCGTGWWTDGCQLGKEKAPQGQSFNGVIYGNQPQHCVCFHVQCIDWTEQFTPLIYLDDVNRSEEWNNFLFAAHDQLFLTRNRQKMISNMKVNEICWVCHEFS